MIGVHRRGRKDKSPKENIGPSAKLYCGQFNKRGGHMETKDR